MILNKEFNYKIGEIIANSSNTKTSHPLINSRPLPTHPYHIVDQSPWPITLSGVLLSLTLSAVLSFHGYPVGDILLLSSFILLNWGMSLWFKDIITEASFLGSHTDKVQKGISLGVVLFIVSEVFFFLSIFWAYFHSSLAPAIEIGSEWPPKGIEPVNASEVPTANTTLLLSSGSAVTVSHHSLVDRAIDWANNGSIATIYMALFFTLLQGMEYFGVSYTITDSVFGSTFYMGTGFHGYVMLPLVLMILFIKNKLTNIFVYDSSISERTLKLDNGFNKDSLILIDKDNSKFELDNKFLEWFVGFTDAEGNFSLTLRDNPNNESKKTISHYVNLTFQIGIHISELSTLNYIKEKLKCGNISISKDRCNYYISNFRSVIYIIIPIFNFFLLNSSKYSQFLIFKEAAEIIQSKAHLTNEGLYKLKHLRSIINDNPCTPELIRITDNWLLGFIEGDATFSTLKFRPRLKFECHIKEEKLFLSIRDYLRIGKVVTYIRNRDKLYYSVILDIWDIYFIKSIIVPKFKNFDFHTNKYLDFCNWCYIVDLYYWGYHLTPEGRKLITKIKSIMNKGRLVNMNKINYEEDIRIKVINLLNSPSPYFIKDGKRTKRI